MRKTSHTRFIYLIYKLHADYFLKTDVVYTPQGNLLEMIKKLSSALKDTDVVAVLSKILSVWRGMYVLVDETEGRDD